jgi:hypothetical protein
VVGEYPTADAAADAAEAEWVVAMLGPLVALVMDKGVGRKWMGKGGEADMLGEPRVGWAVEECEGCGGCEGLGGCVFRGDFLRGDV